MIDVKLGFEINPNIADKIYKAVIDGAKIGSELVVTQAKRFAPVDTGRLLTSIMAENPVVENGAIIIKVGSNVEYAPHVEYGTKKQKPQPYLRPARDLQYDNVIETIKAYLQRALND